MSSRDSWVPLVAGVVLGAGLLAALYHLLLAERKKPESKSKCGVEKRGGDYKCTCMPGCENMCIIHDHRRRM